MKKTLTDRGLRALKPAQSGKTYDMMDAVVPGFGVRISDRGRRTFILVARFPGSRNPTRRALGEYGALTLEEARDKARDWLGMIRKGVDPQDGERRARENTFEMVVGEFIRLALIGPDPDKPKLRSGPEVARDIERELLPRWGHRPITEITPHDVVELVDEIVERGTPHMARNVFATIRRFFNWTISRRIYGIDRSPCDRMAPRDLVGDRVIRDRILSDTGVTGSGRCARARASRPDTFALTP